MSYIKFHAVSETHGYAVEKVLKEYRVVYVEKRYVEGQEDLVKIADSRHNGQLYSYPSPFLADYAIRTEILPLYKDVKQT